MKYNKITLFSTVIILELVATLIKYNKFFFAFCIIFNWTLNWVSCSYDFSATKKNKKQSYPDNPHFTCREFYVIRNVLSFNVLVPSTNLSSIKRKLVIGIPNVVLISNHSIFSINLLSNMLIAILFECTKWSKSKISEKNPKGISS